MNWKRRWGRKVGMPRHPPRKQQTRIHTTVVLHQALSGYFLLFIQVYFNSFFFYIFVYHIVFQPILLEFMLQLKIRFGSVCWMGGVPYSCNICPLLCVRTRTMPAEDRSCTLECTICKRQWLCDFFFMNYLNSLITKLPIARYSKSNGKYWDG